MFKATVPASVLDQMSGLIEFATDEFQKAADNLTEVGLTKVACRLDEALKSQYELWTWLKAMMWVAENPTADLFETYEEIRDPRRREARLAATAARESARVREGGQ